MKKENIEKALIDSGFVVVDGKVSIWDDIAHHEGNKDRGAANVVQPLLYFCAAHGLTMRREGDYCTVSSYRDA